MKRLLTLTAILLLAACGGGTAGQSNIKKYYLARNILFNSVPLVASANAEETVIDTETQINADRILLDNTDTSLNATNVQDAFVETTPDLETAIIGTWSVLQLNGFDEDGTDKDFAGLEVGTITFNTDNTFSYTSNYGLDEAPNPLSVIENLKSDIPNPTLEYRVQSNMIVSLRLKGVRNSTGESYAQLNPIMIIKSQGDQYLVQDHLNTNILIFTKIAN